MKISVIIPVYKVEDYLHQCIDSVLSQTYKNIEVILIDDGSPDNCPAICDDYAKKDNRIRVIHKSNGGLSDARNTGLKEAKGEYIVFLDSDDYYNNVDFFESIVSTLSQKTFDLVCFQRQSFKDGYAGKINYPVLYADQELREDNIGRLVYKLSSSGRLDASACMKFIRRGLILDNNLYFKEGIYSEDIEWFMRVLLCVNSMAVTNIIAYCYRLRSTSISHNVKLKNIQDLFLSVKIYSDIYKQNSDCNLREGVLSYLAYQLFIIMGYTNHILNGKEKLMMMDNIKDYIWLVEYALNKKTKMCMYMYNWFGLNITSYFLGKYLKLKK